LVVQELPNFDNSGHG